MSKNSRFTVSGIATLGMLLASSAVLAEKTGPLVAPTVPSPEACVANSQDNSVCPNWNAVPEKVKPE